MGFGATQGLSGAIAGEMTTPSTDVHCLSGLGVDPTTTSLSEAPALSPWQRWALAALAPIAALCNAAWAATVPYVIDDAPQVWIAAGTGAAERLELSLLLFAGFALTGIAGVLVVGSIARRRAPVLGTTALVTAFVGHCVAVLGGFGIDGIALAAIRAGADVPTTVALVHSYDTLPVTAIIGPLFLLMPLGVLLLGIALWAGHAIPRWSAAALIIGVLLVPIGGSVSMAAMVAGWLLVAAGYARAGLAYAGHR